MVEKEDLSFLQSLSTYLNKALTDKLVYPNKEKTEALVKMEELNGLQLALEYK